MRSSLLVAAALVIAYPLHAQVQVDTTPAGALIDQAMSQCLDKPEGQSTQGMVECIGAAYEAWDKALNEAYGELMNTLDENEDELPQPIFLTRI